MSDWTTRHLPEIDYVIRGRLGDNDCYVDVEAYEAMAFDTETGAIDYEIADTIGGPANWTTRRRLAT